MLTIKCVWSTVSSLWLKHHLKIAAEWEQLICRSSSWKTDQINFTFLPFCPPPPPHCIEDAASLSNRWVLRPRWILNFSGLRFCSNACLHVSRLRSSSGCLSEATWNLCNNQCCVQKQDKVSANLNPPARHFTAIYHLSGCLVGTERQISARVRGLFLVNVISRGKI